ncbi:MAG: hypothetical protein P8J50_08950 [Acidimicrobiales bacterium]|jgi:hypothetical protein|nr:hypothetical protein [Acidimicrobiales bacterium]
MAQESIGAGSVPGVESRRFVAFVGVRRLLAILILSVAVGPLASAPAGAQAPGGLAAWVEIGEEHELTWTVPAVDDDRTGVALQMPVGMTIVSASAEPGGACGPSGTYFDCGFGIGPGGEISIVVAATQPLVLAPIEVTGYAYREFAFQLAYVVSTYELAAADCAIVHAVAGSFGMDAADLLVHASSFLAPYAANAPRAAARSLPVESCEIELVFPVEQRAEIEGALIEHGLSPDDWATAVGEWIVAVIRALVAASA